MELLIHKNYLNRPSLNSTYHTKYRLLDFVQKTLNFSRKPIQIKDGGTIIERWREIVMVE